MGIVTPKGALKPIYSSRLREFGPFTMIFFACVRGQGLDMMSDSV